MSAASFDDLVRHKGHDIVCVTYGRLPEARLTFHVALECRTCAEVLLDYDRPPVKLVPPDPDLPDHNERHPEDGRLIHRPRRVLGEGCEPYEMDGDAIAWQAWDEWRRECPWHYRLARLLRRPIAKAPPRPDWKVRHDYVDVRDGARGDARWPPEGFMRGAADAAREAERRGDLP